MLSKCVLNKVKDKDKVDRVQVNEVLAMIKKALLKAMANKVVSLVKATAVHKAILMDVAMAPITKLDLLIVNPALIEAMKTDHGMLLKIPELVTDTVVFLKIPAISILIKAVDFLAATRPGVASLTLDHNLAGASLVPDLLVLVHKMVMAANTVVSMAAI